MANIWVRSSDGDNANAGTYDAPKLDVAGALAISSPGDHILCSHLHDRQYSANTTLALAGESVVSVADWGTPGTEPTPSYQAGASESCEGATIANYTVNGSGHICGLTFHGGSDRSGIYILSTNGADGHLVFRDCTFEHEGFAYFYIGPIYGINCLVEMIDCDLDVNAWNYSIYVRDVTLRMYGCTLITVDPTIIFRRSPTYGCSRIEAYNCDFSLAGSGKTLFGASDNGRSYALCYRCRLNASVVLSESLADGEQVRFVECDHGTNYIRQADITYEGTVTEDTVRVRDDSDSTYSHKLVSSAYTQFYSPLRSFPVARYNAVEGEEITVRVEVLTDGVTLTDGEFWIEANYLGSASYPLGSIESSAKADILASASNLSTSSEGWTTTDLSSPTKQYAEVTFTPQKSGIIEIVACLAKASTTVYVDPDATVS